MTSGQGPCGSSWEELPHTVDWPTYPQASTLQSGCAPVGCSCGATGYHVRLPASPPPCPPCWGRGRRLGGRPGGYGRPSGWGLPHRPCRCRRARPSAVRTWLGPKNAPLLRESRPCLSPVRDRSRDVLFKVVQPVCGICLGAPSLSSSGRGPFVCQGAGQGSKSTFLPLRQGRLCPRWLRGILPGFSCGPSFTAGAGLLL